MKIAITFYLVFFAFALKADTGGSSPVHKKPVLQFTFQDATVYTDTGSLFSVYRHSDTGGSEILHDRIRGLILKRLHESKNDTVVISEEYPSFDDGKNADTWYADWALWQLLSDKRLTIVDSRGFLVRHMYTRYRGSKREGYIKRVYYNRFNKQPLFDCVTYMLFICPHF